MRLADYLCEVYVPARLSITPDSVEQLAVALRLLDRWHGRPATLAERLLAKAGLPADRKHLFHCLRRTSESYAAAARGISWAAERVGHSESVARRRYVSPAIAAGESLCDVLPRFAE